MNAWPESVLRGRVLTGHFSEGIAMTPAQWDSLARRLWARVDKSAGPDGCWPFTGYRSIAGYGRIRIGGHGSQTLNAHRAAYMVTVRVVLARSVHVLHHCDDPPCCNPAHLFVGTHADNMADKSAKGRQPFGSAHWNSKVTESDVREIKALARAGRRARQIAKQFGISKRAVCDITSGRCWRHVERREGGAQ